MYLQGPQDKSNGGHVSEAALTVREEVAVGVERLNVASDQVSYHLHLQRERGKVGVGVGERGGEKLDLET